MTFNPLATAVAKESNDTHPRSHSF